MPRLVLLLLPLLLAPSLLNADDKVRFSRDILPILSDNCFACHGPDANKRQAGLRLDEPSSALKPSESGKIAIVPGKPKDSALLTRIHSTDKDEVMPPLSFRKTLTPAQKELFSRWIEQGATYEKHWSYSAPTKPAEPTVKNAKWASNAIDRFILERLEQNGLTPRPEANRATLIRRVAFALTGLPPTREEVAKYEADQSPTAYEAMLQRYFDSPREGEEMARHWLDVARYADTHGLHLDNEREMWAYRDWVVRAFNRNAPFDQFTIEQLAGDQLPNPTTEQLIATGFNRCNVTTSEGGSIEAEFLYRYAVDRTATTVQTWMGLTGGCAVCHDHKYDPLSAREFYSLYAFFYSAADPAMDRNIRNTDPFLPLPSPEQQALLTNLKRDESRAKSQLDAAVAKLAVSDPADATPLAGKQPVQDVWLDDIVPLGASVKSTSRNAPAWSLVSDARVPFGERSLRQAFASMYQDRFENFSMPYVIPENATISVAVRLDPHEPPQSIMLELITSKGTRRAIWGDAEKLGVGAVGTPDRLRVGDLPKPGVWSQVKVSGEQLKLTGGESLKGFALAQFGGIANWDLLRAEGELAPSDDPRASFKAFWKSRAGQDSPGVPDDLKAALKAGPDGKASEEMQARLRAFFNAYLARPTPSDAAISRGEYEQAHATRVALEDSIPGTFIFKDVPQPRDAFVMLRGQYDKPGEKVSPGVPAVFPKLKLDDPQRRPQRLDLAQWLLAPEHPLTARVAANRLWQQFFGTGLVKTSDDFGAQGEVPSHPELLDWLAVTYRESGWDTREFVRLLLSSATFRQDSVVLPETLQRDPSNRLYARGPRFRLDAEQIRDNALFVGGILNLTIGGRGTQPYQPTNIWEPVGYSDSNTRFYLQDHGPALYRRSLYTFLKRTAPPPFMSNFDGPNREQSCARRERSNTPLQALQLMNDVQHFEAARSFAERILKDGGTTADERISFAYLTTLSRRPAAEELAVVKSVLAQYLTRFGRDEAAAAKLIRVGESPVKSAAQPAELAAYTLIANLILNLDETVNRN